MSTSDIRQKIEVEYTRLDDLDTQTYADWATHPNWEYVEERDVARYGKQVLKRKEWLVGLLTLHPMHLCDDLLALRYMMETEDYPVKPPIS